mmetsp:Transcript_11412/g.16832  ORF Transcript_11412/g.16832 Transcript_11412/m.16832 type:complete len:513 (-) Transcript_11412:263-1801(-)|eukprot:CAMPEP_0113937532 /NCGR_PEP_ID=MMETSP1339-20121228/4142_1 /TAXON_ID=94617 /ORGANISM="Fibrocapsa japonica" /LENGTH=512 /DNA_ID=CAMNT_0000940341 /DNA_START=77 /DNA_END=1615 /DNA_ORIENTATION=+ /assembly_acc=CAM_ASM_000762
MMGIMNAQEILSLFSKLPVYHQEGWLEPSIPFLLATLIFAFFVYVFETSLDIRQHQRLKDNEVPKQLLKSLDAIDKQIAAEESDKSKNDESGDGKDKDETKLTLLEKVTKKFKAAQAYGLDKSSFGFFKGAFSMFESTLLLLLGFSPYIWDQSVLLSSQYLLSTPPADGGAVLTGWQEIVVSLVFVGLQIVYGTVIGLPFGLYSTFVIEERHGFNKQTLKLYFVDKVKELLLTAIIGSPILAILICVIRIGGEHFYVYVWLVMFIFSLVMMTIYPVLIAPLFNKYEPLGEGSLKTKIEALASSVKFPLTKLYTVDGSKRSAHSNAYMYGFFKNKRIVLYDTLIKQVKESEIVAILGHELGHWKMSHTIQGFVITQIYTLVAFFVFGQVMNNNDLYTSFGFRASEGATKPVLIGLFLFFQTIWSPVDHVLSFLMNILSRRNEFQADAFAVGLGYAPELQRGLVKLQLENLGNLNPDPWYSTYHYSHPPLVERLTAIGQGSSGVAPDKASKKIN